MRLKIKWVNGWAHVTGTDPNGRRIRRALKTKDPRRAEEKRAHLEAQLWRADLYGAEKVVTFAEAALSYAEDGGDTRFIIKITEQIGDMRLRDVTPKVIRDAAKRAYPGTANSTINRQGITPARAVINYAHEQGWCAPIKVKQLPTEKPKRKAVSRDYLEDMREYLPPRLYTLMLFLRQTGRRVSEAIALKPDDRNGFSLTVGKTKNGEPITVKITPEVAALLDEIEPRHGRLFGYRDRSSLYPTLRRAAKKAGVEYLGTHQPGRHSFATALLEAGMPDRAIAEAGGWKSVRMVTDIYQHPSEPNVQAANIFAKENKK